MYKKKDIENKILKGDCLKQLSLIPNNSVDFIFADPPYFMQTQGELIRYEGSKFDGVKDNWDKFDSFKEYDTFCESWLKECKRILKTNGSICVIGSFQNIYRIGYIMQNLNFWIINDIVWNKTNPVPNFAGTRLCNAHETILWCSKDKKSKVSFNYKTMKHLNNDKQERSVWTLPLCTKKERLKDNEGKKVHSTQKPLMLLHKIILSTTKPNDIVLDPFFGTGTTGVAAKSIGRKFIGIEREDKYIEVAQKRIDTTKDESSEITNLKLEKKPPKVPMKTLVKDKYIFLGETLYSPNFNSVARVLENGLLEDGNGNVLSIHKMSAKLLNKITSNGWKYFFVLRNQEYVSIDTLRYKYIKEHNTL